MNCAAVTGSICLRKRRDREPVNARQQPPLAPFDLSVLVARLRTPGVLGPRAAPLKFPRRTAPLASMRRRAFEISDAGIPKVSPSSVAVAGPRCDIHPVTSVSKASSRDGVAVSTSANAARNRASGNNSEKVLARSAATQ